MKLDATTALAHLPVTLRDELLAEFQKIVTNYRERRWEAAELDGGRFSEVAYTVVAGYLNGGNYPPTASKPAKFDQACKALESTSGYPKSARVTVPRVLVALYDIRNNRGVGHVGGDVSANHMDSEFVLHAAQWVMAEFVRIFHGTDLQTATRIVDALVERTVPLIWEVGDVKRVLDPTMKLADATLLLLHSSTSPLNDKTLAKHLEQGRLPNYRRVLRQLHQTRLVEYNETTGDVTLSPLGSKTAEERILPRKV
ncbi:hypothetical protein O7622_26390 [Micromonospora sp. WMMD1076]|uniref:hypothetical protein n=1 Tax=Micromonospora sp. WMMD1076 TaxID=3016103 RepID=UPI00249C322D|nr:hypothetical protein [Micromonospora sp. WMMD1076]WFF06535.1 hypothetical protein O7622_26390 [Micromonospora sp. WMMD1076]